jgi:DNA replication licensing factor MCM4
LIKLPCHGLSTDRQTDPLTGQIDLDLINTGAGTSKRRQHADLKREILTLVDAAGRTGLKWVAAIKALDNQSSIPTDHAEFAAVVKAMTEEGVVKVVGEREKRTIRRLAD